MLNKWNIKNADGNESAHIEHNLAISSSFAAAAAVAAAAAAVTEDGMVETDEG